MTIRGLLLRGCDCRLYEEREVGGLSVACGLAPHIARRGSSKGQGNLQCLTQGECVRLCLQCEIFWF